MRIGLAGVGRIGAFHAATLAAIAAVDEVLVADVDPVRAEVAAKDLDVDLAADLTRCWRPGRRAGDRRRDRRARDAGRARVTAGVPAFCEKPVAPDLAGTIDAAPGGGRADVPVQVGLPAPLRRRATAGRGRRSPRPSWASCTRCAPTPTTRRRRTRTTSRPLAASSATAACTTSTSIRFVTGREVADGLRHRREQGRGSFFADAGDVDTAAAPADAGRRHARHRRDSVQRRRLRRADGGARERRHGRGRARRPGRRCGRPRRA